MNNSPPPEQQNSSDIIFYNEKSLQQLAWGIDASVGNFKLFLARCNYPELRSRFISKLQELTSLKIRVMELKPTDPTLLSKIQQELNGSSPDALMVTGLELVEDLENLLITTNQVREEFRKLKFSLVLWIDDEILKQILRIAPDFESWAITINFAGSPNYLRQKIREITDTFFCQIWKFDINKAIISNSDYKELELAWQDLQKQGEDLEPHLQASLKFLQGRKAHKKDQFGQALKHYQDCESFWQGNSERLGVTLFSLGLCYQRQGEIAGEKYRATVQSYFDRGIEVFTEGDRQDLVAIFINYLGALLEKLEVWDELELVAQKSLELQKNYEYPLKLAQALGFLAQVYLARSQWEKCQEYAQQALDIVKEHGEEYQQNLYLLLLARSVENLDKPQVAIAYLETARKHGVGNNSPQIYIEILNKLHDIYFQKQEYLLAFEVKLERLSIEQQYGLRAFVGAGWIKPQREIKETLNHNKTTENIAPEIVSSGRLDDLKELKERITDNNAKLIIIHGYSGVGKSSLVNGGLLPQLHQETRGSCDILPISIRAYNNWIEELGRLLYQALLEKGKSHQENLTSLAAIIEELQKTSDRNLWIVLIFDQFEEFFFFCAHAKQRRDFFVFLEQCLNTSNVKVVLSLRQDYLHYLLEGNQVIKSIHHDILGKNIRYPLGNFSVASAEAIIKNLTQRAQFNLEEDLIKQLVADLAEDLGEVRPIELQIVGAQMQTEKITTLKQYQEKGTKEELVKRYLDAIVDDCGEENRQIAELVLYFLTDDKGTRPLKTRTELERDLPDLVKEKLDLVKLDLVLQIFVKSGLVLLLPDNPEQRYQLVHDYLAEFIRQQQEPHLKQLQEKLDRETQKRIAAEGKLEQEREDTIRKTTQLNKLLQLALMGSIGKLEQEREDTIRKTTQLNKLLQLALMGSITIGVALGISGLFGWNFAQEAQIQQKKAQIQEINALSNSSELLYSSGQTLDALKEALKAGGKLQFTQNSPLDTEILAITALQQALYLQPQYIARERNRLEDHTGAVSSVALSSDGKTLASGSYDNTIKLWDVATGKLLQTLSGHSSWVLSVAWSSDGKTLASGSDDNTIKLWDVATGKLLQTLSGHSSSVYSVAWSSDGKTLASGSYDNTIKLWDVATGKLLQTLSGHSSWVLSVAWSSDGKTLASGSYDNTIKLWDVATGKLLQTLSGHSSWVLSVAWSSDGKTLASGSDDKTIKLWDVATGKLLQTLSGHSSSVYSVAWSSDGKTLASGSYDNTIKLWDVATGKLLQTLSGHSSSVLSVAWSSDGKTLASGSYDKTIKLWDVATGKLLQTLSGHSSRVLSVAWSSDGKTLASGSDDKTIKLWDVATGKLLQTLSGHSSRVLSVAWSSDGKTLASGSDDKTIKLWDVATGKLLQTLSGHSSSVLSVAWSSDGKTLASGSYDNTIKLWDVATGKLLQTLSGHSSWVLSVAWSSDGKTLASGSYDNTIKLWDVATGKLLQTLSGHSSWVLSVAWSSDGKTLASGSDDKTIKLWDVATGKLLQTLSGHSSSVYSVAWSSDGKTLASGSEDKTIKLWDVATGKLLQTLSGHSSRVYSVAWSSDGKTLASGSYDKTIILWNLDLKDLDLKDLLGKGCQFIDNFLVIHPDILSEVEACQTPTLRTEAAKVFVLQGEKLARQQDRNNAIKNFQNALKWNPQLNFDAQRKAQQLVNAAFYLQRGGEKLSKENGNLQDAIADIEKALKIDPDLDVNQRLNVALLLIKSANNILKKDPIKDFIKDNIHDSIFAITEAQKPAITEAQKLVPSLTINKDKVWNSLCWYSSIKGFAKDVMLACEKAVELEPDNEGFRDSRGLARALTGNIEGAIEDFQVYIDKTNDQIKKEQRQGWVKALQSGQNPFTKQELDSLL